MIRKIIEILLFLVIIVFFFTFVFNFFNELFFKSTDISNKFTEAFMGAFLAFLFVRIGDALTRLYERKVKHYNALVRFEKEMNIYLNVISDNIFIVDDFIKALKEIIDQRKTILYFNALHKFSIDKNIGFDFHNLDLVNSVFLFEVRIGKMNNSIVSTNRFYSDIKVAFIEKDIDFDTYRENTIVLKDKLMELKKFLFGLKQECKELGAMTRLLMREKPFLMRLINLFLRKKFSIRMKDEISKEVKRLEEEISVTQQKSKKRISSILGDNKQNSHVE